MTFELRPPEGSFLQTFEEVVGGLGRRVVESPAGLVAQWDTFVRSCEEGYYDTIYEFEDERSVRDALEVALTDPRLQGCAELTDLRESVYEVDVRFRSACRRDVSLCGPGRPWWHVCVPTNIFGALARDLKDLYGIEDVPQGTITP